MAQNIAPKADQPRVTTENLKRDSGSPTLQYKIQGMKNSTRSNTNKNYGRAIRG